MPGAKPVETYPTFNEAVRVWWKIGLNSFGGPAGQIAVMHRVLVEEKRWISESRFLHALNYCMLLPGPEAQQLATYIGWLLHRTAGGLVAGALFVLPGFAAILVLSVLYARYQDWTLVEGLFWGIKPAVMAIVLEAVIRIGKRALKSTVLYAVAAAAFIAIFFFTVPFPAIVLTAALIGFIGGRLWPASFTPGAHGRTGSVAALAGPVISEEAYHAPQPTVRRFVGTLAVWLVLWWTPVLGLLFFLGREHVFVQEGLFFSKAAVVTFGGAYAVLAYLAQQAVEHYGWLQPTEMLDGLGMAETTPGPLIMVVQFVGFMGAYRNPGALEPMTAAVFGSVLTTWVTFTPCFLWIFLGAPYIESLRGNRALTTALTGITAAVVGVVLNLGVWFAIHTLFGEVDEIWVGPLRVLIPEWDTLDWAAALLAIAAAVAVFRFKLSMIRLIISAALIGALYTFFVNT